MTSEYLNQLRADVLKGLRRAQELEGANVKLLKAAKRLVRMYIANYGTKYEFISCITPPHHASRMTRKQRAADKTWFAWDALRKAVEEQDDDPV